MHAVPTKKPEETVVSLHMGTEIELQSNRRADGAVNLWAIYPALIVKLFYTHTHTPIPAPLLVIMLVICSQ